MREQKRKEKELFRPFANLKRNEEIIYKAYCGI